MKFEIDQRRLVKISAIVTAIALAFFVLVGLVVGVKTPFSIMYLGGGLLTVWPYLAVVSLCLSMEEKPKGEDRGDSGNRDSVADADTTRAGE